MGLSWCKHTFWVMARNGQRTGVQRIHQPARGLISSSCGLSVSAVGEGRHITAAVLRRVFCSLMRSHAGLSLTVPGELPGFVPTGLWFGGARSSEHLYFIGLAFGLQAGMLAGVMDGAVMAADGCSSGSSSGQLLLLGGLLGLELVGLHKAH